MEPLTPYIERYFATWLHYAQHICARYRLRMDAYDLVGDAMENLCRKPAEILDEFLEEENKGHQKLKFYVRRMILYSAIDLLRKGRRWVDIDKVAYRLAEQENDEIAYISELCELEAQFREDNFIVPKPTRKGGEINGNICMVINHKRLQYRAYTGRKGERKYRCFSTRRAAFEFQMAISNQ